MQPAYRALLVFFNSVAPLLARNYIPYSGSYVCNCIHLVDSAPFRRPSLWPPGVLSSLQVEDHLSMFLLARSASALPRGSQAHDNATLQTLHECDILQLLHDTAVPQTAHDSDITVYIAGA
jgi:hypothetical protein